MMVGQRRGLLDYLKKTDLDGYRALIEKLGIENKTIFRVEEEWTPPYLSIIRRNETCVLKRREKIRDR